ncbi:MAG: lytic transglycosylase domain-containing protein [Desulfomonilaceae bacterium]
MPSLRPPAVSRRASAGRKSAHISIRELDDLKRVILSLGGNPSYARILVLAGREFNIDPVFIAAVAHVESSFRPRAASCRNARGLMQLRPIVIKVLGVTDPWNPHQNIMAGAAYLRHCFERYKHCRNSTYLALAAYNIGPGSVEKLKRSDAAGRFVRKVLRVYNRLTDAPIPLTGKALKSLDKTARSPRAGNHGRIAKYNKQMASLAKSSTARRRYKPGSAAGHRRLAGSLNELHYIAH